MSDIPVIIKRRLQAEVIGPIFREMEVQVGRQQAEAILDAAIRKAAVSEGAQYRTSTPDQDVSMKGFIDLHGNWQAGGAMEIDFLEKSESRYDFNVTRCKYAEMYHEMGLGDIGHLLSCNRDGTFCEGFNPNIKLERRQTIMQGAEYCTFRYSIDGPNVDNSKPKANST